MKPTDRIAQEWPEATHVVRINGECLPLRVRGPAFYFLDGSEQCHDCGGKDYSLSVERNALKCNTCESLFALESIILRP